MSVGDISDATREAANRALLTGQASDPEVQRQIFLRTGMTVGETPGLTGEEWRGSFWLAGLLGFLALALWPSLVACRGYLHPGSPEQSLRSMVLPLFLVATWGTTWFTARRLSPLVAFVYAGTGFTLGILRHGSDLWVLGLLVPQLMLLVGEARARKHAGGGWLALGGDLTLGFLAGFFLLVFGTDPRAATWQGAVLEILGNFQERHFLGYPAACGALASLWEIPSRALSLGLPTIFALGYIPAMKFRDWIFAPRLPRGRRAP